jgi:tripartite-type tricarboxylate transporter receptor subunit TctC
MEIIAPHSPGGPSDMIARSLTSELPSKKYNVVYKPGAGTLSGIRYTIDHNGILISTFIQTFVTNPKSYDNLNYNPNDDLEIIATIAVMPSILVCHNKNNFKTYEDFKNSKKTLTFGIAGYGSTEHIITEILFLELQKRHRLIPYSRGGANAITDLIGGHIDCIFSNYPTAKNHLENKSIIPLISTHKITPLVSSWEEQFKIGFPIQSFIGLVISKNASQELRKEIIEDLKTINIDNLRKRLLNLGFFPDIGIRENDVNNAINNNNLIKKIIEEKNIKLKD